MAEQSEACSVFGHLNTVIQGSNATRGMVVCPWSPTNYDGGDDDDNLLDKEMFHAHCIKNFGQKT
jgi:hypothetical protein